MVKSKAPARLTPNRFRQGLNTLIDRDRDLAFILSEYGEPPFWSREPSFGTLVQIILEQQVSLASANAAYKKLLVATNPLTPENYLRLDDEELRQIGFSRQKAGYVRGLSKSILRGDLNLSELENLDDSEARAELMKIKGIGPWTADIYLLIALGRPDIWPSGDLALVKAVQYLHGFPDLPAHDEMERTAAPWKPWRAVAARILWHYYLSRRVD